MQYDTGSFRDPAGRILHHDGRILRAVFPPGQAAFEAALDDGVLHRAVDKGHLLEFEPLTVGNAPVSPPLSHLLEHPKLDFISYPYEWCFSELRKAALLHLDFHLDLLEQGHTLSDATAYNIQFRATEPVFIDHLSIVPYTEGELWTGQRQFAMQFLCPLLLFAKRGIAPNAWYRGNLEGIAPEDLVPLLSWKTKLSPTVLGNVVLPARLQQQAIDSKQGGKSTERKLPKKALVALLQQLRNYIDGLQPPGGDTVWAGYDSDNSYDGDRRAAKHAFVGRMVEHAKPGTLVDLGCNSGEYSQVAIDAGAATVIGFDFDFGALEEAFARFSDSKANVLPLWLDAMNPSPSQGWAEAERKSFSQRCKADALIALAFIHHIAIARNVPLDMAVDWLIGLAPAGVIEFPPKSDPMVQELLSSRPDIFPDYTVENFIVSVEKRARIVAQERLGGDGRVLVHYERTS